MQRHSLLVFIIILVLLGSACEDQAPTPFPPPDITGTWRADDNSGLDLYQFLGDGRGQIRSSSGVGDDFSRYLFTYQFTAVDTLTFAVDGNPPITMRINLNEIDRLRMHPQVEGGIPRQLTRIGPCAAESLSSCLLGRWVRYWPDGQWTLYEFYPDQTGVAYVPGSVASTHFPFTISEPQTILLGLADGETISLTAVQPDNYTLQLNAAEEKDSFTLYRVDLP